LIEVFARGIHRAPIVSPQGNMMGLLSQSDVIAMLDKPMREERLLEEGLGPKTLKELGLGVSEGIMTMSVTTQTILAFWVIYFNKISAIAVVDSEGRLLGNLSASDIRGIGGSARRFSSLLLPIGEFLQLDGPEACRAAITCTLDTTFEQVIALLARNKIHRVWVVDNDRPIGLVSLTDIMLVITRVEPSPQ